MNTIVTPKNQIVPTSLKGQRVESRDGENWPLLCAFAISLCVSVLSLIATFPK